MKSHFRFNKQERSGIFFLLLLIVIVQGIYLLLREIPSNASRFALNTEEQKVLDSLKSIPDQGDTFKMYPFNPNFMTDYKGYRLGLSPEELDRLNGFRASGKFVNSASEFQKVTQIPDSLLQAISPYFKFPEWKKRSYSSPSRPQQKLTGKGEIRDLNKATIDNLKEIYGIGDKLSARIVKFRDRLGGFLVDEQLYDVYGLETEVANRVLKTYQVLQVPDIQKIDVNRATAQDLSRLIYINLKLANEIVAHRELNGPYKSLDDLAQVQSFPKERIGRIKLYLTLKN